MSVAILILITIPVLALACALFVDSMTDTDSFWWLKKKVYVVDWRGFVIETRIEKDLGHGTYKAFVYAATRVDLLDLHADGSVSKGNEWRYYIRRWSFNKDDLIP